MSTPPYLQPYTKHVVDNYLESRDAMIAKRCMEVGKQQTMIETGWSMSLVMAACKKNNVKPSKRGRKPLPRTMSDLQVLESTQHFPKSYMDSNLVILPNYLVNSTSYGHSIPKRAIEVLNPYEGLFHFEETREIGELLKTKTANEMVKMFEVIHKPPAQIRGKYFVKPKPLPAGIHVDQPEQLPDGSVAIELTRGLFAIVDQDMLPVLRRFNWSAKPDYRTVYGITRDQNQVEVKMHRLILGLPTCAPVIVDHINHNGVDNRRCNLRIVPNDINQLNRDIHPKIKSRFKGVSFYTGKWGSQIKVNGRLLKKYFDTEEEAARHYDQMVLTYRGHNAPTNASMGRY